MHTSSMRKRDGLGTLFPLTLKLSSMRENILCWILVYQIQEVVKAGSLQIRNETYIVAECLKNCHSLTSLLKVDSATFFFPLCISLRNLKVSMVSFFIIFSNKYFKMIQDSYRQYFNVYTHIFHVLNYIRLRVLQPQRFHKSKLKNCCNVM